MLLVIDTATAACSAALAEGSDLLDERHEIVGRGHAERLLPMVEDLLDGRRPEAILVDCGPGSFTGLRVGIAAAQGLRIGWQVPLWGYSSTSLLAAGAETDEVGVALKGGHGQLFVQSFRHDPLRATDELRSLLPEEASSAIRPELVIGSGAEALVERRGYGRALDILPRAGEARWLPDELRSLPPRAIYARAPDARPMA